jgi:hypothetical protein
VTIVAALAGSVGLTELLGRYRSDPTGLVRYVGAWLYVGLNALACVGALFLIRELDLTFGQRENVDLWRVLVAGFGAITFFRSSLFVIRIGNANVGVGPSLVLGVLLDTFDRDVDRRSASQMSDVIRAPSLDGLDPVLVMDALPVLCLALMQNFGTADQAQLGAELDKVRVDPDMTDEAKMRATIVQLAKYLSPELVARVLVNAREIFVPAPPTSVAIVEDARRVLAEEAAADESEAPER